MKLIPVRWWTRRCDGTCGDTSAHDAHLTIFGQWALGRWKLWKFKRLRRAVERGYFNG